MSYYKVFFNQATTPQRIERVKLFLNGELCSRTKMRVFGSKKEANNHDFFWVVKELLLPNEGHQIVAKGSISAVYEKSSLFYLY